MAELNNKFSGQAAARLDTYAGKLSLISVAAANSREIIGKGLLDALSALGKDNSIASVTNSMEDFATATSEVLVGLGKVIGKLKEITNVPGIDGSFLRNIPGIGAVLRATEALRGAGRQETDRGGQERTAGRVNAQQRKIEDKLNKAKALELNTLLKKNAIENKNVEELRKKFDIERIGITAALNSATDQETKLRLQAQLAILDNNEAMAKKLLAELEAAEALKKLAEQARLAGMSIEEFGIFKVKTLSNKIDTYIEDMGISIIRELNARIATMLSKFNLNTPTTTGQTFTGPSGATYTAPQVQAAILDTRELNSRINDFLSGFNGAGVQRTSSQAPTEIRVTVDANSDRLSQAIAESIQVANRSGYSTVPAGFIV
jgi:hypothetical protein